MYRNAGQLEDDYPLAMTQSGDRRLLRASDAERAEACEALGRHFTVGRLDLRDFEDRTGAASAARTLGDLQDLFDDLPLPHPGSRYANADNAAQPPFGPHPIQEASGSLQPYDPAAHGVANRLTAPYGVQAFTGRPYSDKHKVPAGVLQILLGSLGVGRFYTGHTKIALVQLLITVLTLGMAAPLTVLWGLIDGVVILAGDSTDRHGRPLR